MSTSVCFLSRQRLVGNTNGSSRYVLSIVDHLTRNGLSVHYVCPVPSVFGRWPFLYLRKEISAFSSYSIRGAVRCGPVVINPDLRVWGQAAVALLDLLSRRLGLGLPQLGRVRTPPMHEDLELSEKERAYLARVAGPLADAILCDYGTMAAAISAVSRPDAPSAVIMHELFSSRDPTIDPEVEARMLTRADVVITIQDDEAECIRRHAPQARLMPAPMAVEAAHEAQPGEDDTLLFVASQTPANIEGLNWFAAKVWPILRRRRPTLRLDVVGTVARGIGPMPEGIRMLGLIPDLGPLYETAGVVVSPLRSGTGLKIKLIEAMAAGKCIVGTSVTSQGVEQLVADTMCIQDNAERFAEAVLALAANAHERRRLGEASLALARARFSPNVCYDGLLRFLGQARRRSDPVVRDQPKVAGASL